MKTTIRPNDCDLRASVQAALVPGGRPVTLRQLCSAVQQERGYVEGALHVLEEDGIARRIGSRWALEMHAPRVLVADPPWEARDQLPGNGRGAKKKYETMSVEQICSFELPALDPDAWLFLWRVSWLPQAALDVCQAWGFTPKSEIVWLKREPGGRAHFGMGHYVRNAHETCIIATRGKAAPHRQTARIPSFFEAAPPLIEGTRKVEHSAKPEKFFDLVEVLVRGPYAELFARRIRDGWDCYGRGIGRSV